MKIIKINESQKKRLFRTCEQNKLFEAYREGFSFENLTMIGGSAFGGENNSEAQMRYCTHWLGYPDSMGSSRAVYTLNDSFVLKLAYGNRYQAGIAQNKAEYELYQRTNSPLITKILYCDKNYTYLVSEQVLPCTEEDFEKFLGLPFYSVYKQNSIKSVDSESIYGGDYRIGYNKYFDNIKKPHEPSEVNIYNVLGYIEANFAINEPYYDKDLENAIASNNWFKQLIELVKETGMTDFVQLENFGIVNRNGKPMIVVLDSGLNLDVWEKYYNMW